MSTAERLLQQGFTQGRERGLGEGLEKGLAEGRAQTLERLLTLKFGPLSEETRTRIATASIAELDRWTDRVLTATSLREALG
jgi:flagellar biosynthesis/type III secretory pathway protein FliH